MPLVTLQPSIDRTTWFFQSLQYASNVITHINHDMELGEGCQIYSNKHGKNITCKSCSNSGIMWWSTLSPALEDVDRDFDDILSLYLLLYIILHPGFWIPHLIQPGPLGMYKMSASLKLLNMFLTVSFSVSIGMSYGFITEFLSSCNILNVCNLPYKMH